MKTTIPSIIRSLRWTAICLALLCTLTMPAYAATQLVTNTSDNDFGSLRYVLADSMDGDTIDATGVSGTILLTSGELVVNKNLTINGPGADQLAVDGNAASRVFHISPGKTVTISGLTITNGNAVDDVGGGIFNEYTTLTVNDCTISGNSAGAGGGIMNWGKLPGHPPAALTINNSTISGNSATSASGGIHNIGNTSGSATLTIINSTLSGNSATLVGGIWNDGESGSATLTVTNSTLSGNSASNLGGGIFNDGAGGGSALLEIGSTILNAGASGANIVNFNNLGTVTSLGYNLSSDNAGGFLIGTGDLINTDPILGPLANNGGPTLTHALLPGSPAIDAGTDLTALNGAISATATILIVTDATSIPADVGFAIQIDSEQMIVNAKSGNTMTVTRGANGTTAAAHSNGAAVNPAFDQRGASFARKVGSAVDIGAFEVQATTSVVCPQPQGYWKNNPDAWPVESLMLGDQNYTKVELLNILNTPVHGDASLILAYQLIAAKLNIANGVDGTPVSDTITDADTLLTGFVGQLPYHVKPSSSSGQSMTNDANLLANYNNTECTP